MNRDHLPPADLRMRIAQLIYPRIGSNLPPVITAHEDASRIADLLVHAPIGGLCVFNGDWQKTPLALAELQTLSSLPLMIGADLELGAGQQIHGLTVFPHAMALDAIDDRRVELAEQFGCFTGREALAAGVHMVLGPVADVNSDPRNPIIATRAFGRDPGRVAELVTAYIRGCQSSGAVCAAKHFPGHGNTYEDSHVTLPTVDADYELLRRRDLVPFQAAINAGVRLIMSAHVAYPALDPSGLPATISRRILTDLLRDKMGFEGVVISDSLLMSGVRERFASEVDLAEAALLAGVDILLDIAEPATVVDGLVRRVESDSLPEARIDEAWRRVASLKSTVARQTEKQQVPQKQRQVGEPTPGRQYEAADWLSSRDESERCAQEIACQSITRQSITGPDAVAFEPLSRDRSLGVLVVRPFCDPVDPPEQPLVTAIRQIQPATMAWKIGPELAGFADIEAAVMKCEQLIIAIIVKPAAWQQFGLLPEQKSLLLRIVSARPSILVSLGVPTILDEFPAATYRFCTYSDVPVSQVALAGRLFG